MTRLTLFLCTAFPCFFATTTEYRNVLPVMYLTASDGVRTECPVALIFFAVADFTLKYMVYLSEELRDFLPFFLLLASMARPLFVESLFLKPCLLIFFLFDG